MFIDPDICKEILAPEERNGWVIVSLLWSEEKLRKRLGL
jgi:hypothetical protein